MPENDTSDANNDSPRVTQNGLPPGEPAFWLFAWLGTALAGGAFGLLLALEIAGIPGLVLGILGIFYGTLIAAIVAAPVFLTTATACWALGLRRIRPFLAVLGGAATGILSTLFFSTDGTLTWLTAEAGLLGAAGSGIALAVRKKLHDDAGGNVGPYWTTTR